MNAAVPGGGPEPGRDEGRRRARCRTTRTSAPCWSSRVPARSWPCTAARASTRAHCVRINCQYNMAMQSREQVGSSFKPYVLATAVAEGMNVQDSVLNGIEPMCVPPDTSLALRDQLSTETTNCPADWFGGQHRRRELGPAQRDQGGRRYRPTRRSRTSSTGPAPRPRSTWPRRSASTRVARSGLQAKVGEVGLALGIASLTVEEQATTFATLADGRRVRHAARGREDHRVQRRRRPAEAHPPPGAHPAPRPPTWTPRCRPTPPRAARRSRTGC